MSAEARSISPVGTQSSSKYLPAGSALGQVWLQCVDCVPGLEVVVCLPQDASSLGLRCCIC